jgi:hypothetical protein
MKSKQFFILFLAIVLSFNAKAQFKIDSTVWKKAKEGKYIKDEAIVNSHEKGQVVYRTKQFMITKLEMFTSQFLMSFSKDNGEYSFWIKYAAEISDIHKDSIYSVLFVFTDGSELEFPKKINCSKTTYSTWTHYVIYTKISPEEIELFAKKRLLAVKFNVESDKRNHSATIPNNRSIELAQMVHYFLTKEKLTTESILKVFDENQKVEKYVNNAWNF